MRTHDLHGYIKKFRSGTILVVGDLILDQYIWGPVSRISPEAPVPVVNVSSETLQLGGAAMTDRDRPTTRKTRVIAHNQQLVRFDVERCHPISGALEARLSRYVAACIGSAKAVVVSDYAKGVVTPRLMSDIIDLAGRRGTPVIVDPKVTHIGRYKGVTVLTPNHLEAIQAAGLHGDDDATLLEAGRQLHQRLGCQAVLITRGERGMSLFEEGGHVTHIPTVAQQVFDVTGAGDTVVATLALALAAGAPMRHAAKLANYAAGIVVGMIGTGTVTSAQLDEALTRG